MGESPCSELEIRRARVADVARATLAGRMRVVGAIQELAALQPDVDPGGEDAELLQMVELSTRGKRATSSRDREQPDPEVASRDAASIDADDPALLQAVQHACRVLLARYS